MIDVLYVAWNRRAFTEMTFGMLLANTDWDRVRKFVVYDDSSTDGTAEFLAAYHGERIGGAEVEVRTVDMRSPPAVMNHYVTASDAKFFAKIDSDIVVPEGWLGHMVDVIDANPEVELLGMEAGRTDKPPAGFSGPYGFEASSHTGGVGVFRTSAFSKRPPLNEQGGRFGFTEWQHIYRPTRGWIKPDLLLSSLDQVPLEPWRTLTQEYHAKGWMRKTLWPEYDHRWTSPYYDWWAS